MAENGSNKSSGHWKSRKAQLAATAFGASFAVSSFAFLVLGKMTAAEWISFNQFLIPTILTIYGASNVVQKKLMKE